MATLTAEDTQRLRAVYTAERDARQEAELLAARAKVLVLEAAKAKNELVAALAKAHGFDPDEPFQCDWRTGEITQGQAV